MNLTVIEKFQSLGIPFQFLRSDFLFHFHRAFPGTKTFLVDEIDESLVQRLKGKFPDRSLHAYISSVGTTTLLLDEIPVSQNLL